MSLKINKLSRAVGDYARGVTSERNSSGQIEHYVVEKQNLDAVKKHVERRDEYVNEAPAAGNKHDMHYVGSIPMAVLTDWVRKNGYSMNDFATNKDGCKDKFLVYLKTEMPAFLTKRAPKTFAVS